MLSRRGALLLLGAVAARGEDSADRVVIYKAKREMLLYRGDRVLRRYKVALGTHPVGRKERKGDHKTPEGDYTIDARNPRSAFHLSLRISYPNAEDRARARRLRVDPGGDVAIHGLPNGQGHIGKAHLATDWTWGCVAVTDQEIEEVWRLVPSGTKVRIEP